MKYDITRELSCCEFATLVMREQNNLPPPECSGIKTNVSVFKHELAKEL